MFHRDGFSKDSFTTPSKGWQITTFKTWHDFVIICLHKKDDDLTLVCYFHIIHLYKRLCLNELQKEYCVKTKVIAMDWQWVTLRSWCQINRNGHSSPVKHKVQGKLHKILEKLKIMSGKSNLFGRFFVKFFFRLPEFTSVFLLIQIIKPLYFTHVWLCVDLIFALLMNIWWFYFGFGSCEWKRKKHERQVGFKGK